LNIDIDHIGEQPMTTYLPKATALVAAWIITNTLWMATLTAGIA
jgi:hypothetical protein